MSREIDRRMAPWSEMEEQERVKLLTGTSWNAGVDIYDFLHGITFNPDGTGKMLSGGGQVLSLDVNFRYELLEEGIRFEYQETNNSVWGLRFEPTKENRVKIVGLAVSHGIFDIEETSDVSQRFHNLISFSDSPFPIGSGDAYSGNLFFAGNPKVDKSLLEFYGYGEPRVSKIALKIQKLLSEGDQSFWVGTFINPQLLEYLKTWKSYGNDWNTTEGIIEARLWNVSFEFGEDPEMQKKVRSLGRVFKSLAYVNMSAIEQKPHISEVHDTAMVIEGMEIDDEMKEAIKWIWKTFNLRIPDDSKLPEWFLDQNNKRTSGFTV